ncbi:MAG: CAP domain-containing protein [Gallionella sp.]|nr:CAP domain-containing protein [Gallionella sp.]
MKLLFAAIAVALTAALASIPALASETNLDSAVFVAVHNKWRTQVGVKEELIYSPTLALRAQAWADNLMKSNQCKMRHSKPNGKYGENLYWASAMTWSDGRIDLQEVSPNKVVDSWGSEKADYDYAKNNCKSGKMCGHYTQIVWRDTKSVGCGMAVCADTREQVWVCQYQPAGNWVGRRPY